MLTCRNIAVSLAFIPLLIPASAFGQDAPNFNTILGSQAASTSIVNYVRTLSPKGEMVLAHGTSHVLFENALLAQGNGRVAALEDVQSCDDSIHRCWLKEGVAAVFTVRLVAAAPERIEVLVQFVRNDEDLTPREYIYRVYKIVVVRGSDADWEVREAVLLRES